jgi:hypothetical protein
MALTLPDNIQDPSVCYLERLPLPPWQTDPSLSPLIPDCLAHPSIMRGGNAYWRVSSNACMHAAQDPRWFFYDHRNPRIEHLLLKLTILNIWYHSPARDGTCRSLHWSSNLSDCRMQLQVDPIKELQAVHFCGRLGSTRVRILKPHWGNLKSGRLQPCQSLHCSCSHSNEVSKFECDEKF